MTAKKTDVVVLGGGPAGRAVVQALHEAEKRIDVILVRDEISVVHRCVVPFAIDARQSLTQYQVPNEEVTEQGAELLIDRATRIDTRGYEVHTESGEVLSYGRLVLALGARPNIPEIPGVAAQNIFALRSIQDLRLLRKFAADAERVVVLGADYVGVEVAAQLRHRGLDVQLVDSEPRILAKSLDTEFAEEVEATMAGRGIGMHLNARAERFASEGELARSLVLADGTELHADFFVLGTGAVPNVELAKEAGLEVAPDGIVVDAHLRSSVENVFAIGDCAQKRSMVSGHPTRAQHGTIALFMAQVAARNLLGETAEFPGIVNSRLGAAFHWSFGAAGLTPAEAEEAGFSVRIGSSEVLDRYPMIEGAAPVRTKLCFDSRTGRLLGGTVLHAGQRAAGSIDFLGLAIQMGVRARDLERFQYAAHPELASEPTRNGFVLAAREALR